MVKRKNRNDILKISSQPFIEDKPLKNSKKRIVKSKTTKAGDISFDR